MTDGVASVLGAVFGLMRWGTPVRVVDILIFSIYCKL